MLVPALVMKAKGPAIGKRGDKGRFITLRSGRVIFIPKGYKSKWADVREGVLASQKRPAHRSYTTEASYLVRGGEIETRDITVYVTQGKSELPPEIVTAAKKERYPIVPVVYNADSGSWHIGIVSSAAGDMLHETYFDEAREGMPWEEFDYRSAKGYWDPARSLVHIDPPEKYGIGAFGAGRHLTPMEARRKRDAAARTFKDAWRNLFTVGGKQPDVGRQSWNREAGQMEIKEGAI